MREIKFRAWYKYGKKMVDLYKITPFAVADHNGTMDGLFLPFDNNMILMQFTGLLDKNGKDIFEGDVLKLTHEYDQTEDKFHLHDFIDDTCYLRMFDMENIEIIGNQYENPELISPKTNNTPNRT